MTRKIRCSVCRELHNPDDVRKLRSGKYICTDCIDGENYIECQDCHIVEERCLDVDPTLTEVADGRLVCDECLRARYIKCDVCEKYHHINNMRSIDGVLVCDECVENNYTVCSHCGNWVRNNRAITTVDTEEVYCESCARSHLYRCCNCGDYYENRLDLDYRQLDVCEACAEEDYTHCDDCGYLVHSEDLMIDEGDEVCPECYQRRQNVILDYHASVNFEKKQLEDEETEEYFGLELEVAGSKSCAKEFQNIVGKKDIVLMNDGSILPEGFEIITMPLSYKYINEQFRNNLDKGLKFLQEKGFNGHNYGGLHIHISREIFNKNQLGQIREILYGNKNDRKTWLILTQRKAEKMSRWTSMENGYQFYSITDNQAEYPSIGSSRYTAVNYDDRTRTYEFRIFNSNLRIERIMKNIQIVKAIIDYTAEHREDERPVCNTTGLLEYIMQRRIFYPELSAYLDETNIYEQHIAKEYTLQEVA